MQLVHLDTAYNQHPPPSFSFFLSASPPSLTSSLSHFFSLSPNACGSYHTPLTLGPEPLTFVLSCLCVCPSSPGPPARPVRFQPEGSYVFNGYKIIDNNTTSNTNNNNCHLLGTYQTEFTCFTSITTHRRPVRPILSSYFCNR